METWSWSLLICAEKVSPLGSGYMEFRESIFYFVNLLICYYVNFKVSVSYFLLLLPRCSLGWLCCCHYCYCCCRCCFYSFVYLFSFLYLSIYLFAFFSAASTVILNFLSLLPSLLCVIVAFCVYVCVCVYYSNIYHACANVSLIIENQKLIIKN